MTRRRWGVETGWRYQNLFIDEPGGLNFPGYEWWEIRAVLAGRSIRVFRTPWQWLNGRAPHPGARPV